MYKQEISIELSNILDKLQDVEKSILYLEEYGKKMKTFKRNTEFMIQDVEELIKYQKENISCI